MCSNIYINSENNVWFYLRRTKIEANKINSKKIFASVTRFLFYI